MLAAEQSCGKTTLLMDWGYRMARGQKWHGREVRAGSSLFLLGEGWRGMGQRIKAWYAANPSADPASHAVRFAALPNLADQDGMLAMVKHLEEEKYQMVVVDTMNMALPGVDENSATDIAFYFRALNELVTMHKCSFVTTHHLNKGLGGVFGINRIRGSTAIVGSLDTVLMLEMQGDVRLLKQEKQRDSERGSPVHMALKTMQLDDGSSGPYLVPASQEQREDVNTLQTVRRVLADLAAEGATLAQLQAETGVARSTLMRTVQRLGCWWMETGKAGQRRFWLPGQHPEEASRPTETDPNAT
jgi:hypothetical protein